MKAQSATFPHPLRYARMKLVRDARMQLSRARSKYEKVQREELDRCKTTFEDMYHQKEIPHHLRDWLSDRRILERLLEESIVVLDDFHFSGINHPDMKLWLMQLRDAWSGQVVVEFSLLNKHRGRHWISFSLPG